MYKIYKIVNSLNENVYIGQTRLSVEERFRHHIIKSKLYKERPLYKAMNELGVHNFSIQLIVDNIKTKEDANKLERFYIRHYNSYIKWDNCKGYNASTGGDAGTCNSKTVYQVDSNFEIVNIFDSTHEAARYMGGLNSVICRVCNKQRKLAYGYVWMYEDEYMMHGFDNREDSFIDMDKGSRHRFRGKIKECDLTSGNVIIYDSIDDCMKNNPDIHPGCIRRVLRGERNYTHNKVFTQVM